jgi:hypothetical protein
MINTLKIASSGHIGFSLNRLITIASMGFLTSNVSDYQLSFLGNSVITCKSQSYSIFNSGSEPFGENKYISTFTSKISLSSMAVIIGTNKSESKTKLYERSYICCKVGYSSQITTNNDFKSEIK